VTNKGDFIYNQRTASYLNNQPAQFPWAGQNQGDCWKIPKNQQEGDSIAVQKTQKVSVNLDLLYCESLMQNKCFVLISLFHLDLLALMYLEIIYPATTTSYARNYFHLLICIA
jgi:hypothetical protein